MFGLLIAVLLNQKIKGLGLFRTIYYLPSVIVGGGGVAAVGVDLQTRASASSTCSWRRYSGSRGPAWLADETWVIPALIIMSLWGGRAGPMLIYLAGPAERAHPPTTRRRSWTAPTPGQAVPENHRADDLAGDPVQPDHGASSSRFQVFTPRLRDDRRGGPNHGSLMYVAVPVPARVSSGTAWAYAAAQAWNPVSCSSWP